MNIQKMKKLTLVLILAVPLFSHAGTVTIVGNGAGTGPIFVTSTAGNIDIGTRVRVGTFINITTLNNTISAFTSGSSTYSDTLLALNNNFTDLGSGVTNYGSSSQVANGSAPFTPSSTQFGFNNYTTLTVNGVSGVYNTFNGSLTSVNYSLSLGSNTPLYIWTAFNSEIGIVRNADGTGTSAWTTPGSDLSGVTLNLSGLLSSGAFQANEILLGTTQDNASGNDFIKLQAVPEPSTGLLMMVGALGLVATRRLRKA